MSDFKPRSLEIFDLLRVPEMFQQGIAPLKMRLYDGHNIVKTWDFAVVATKTPSIPYVGFSLSDLH